MRMSGAWTARVVLLVVVLMSLVFAGVAAGQTYNNPQQPPTITSTTPPTTPPVDTSPSTSPSSSPSTSPSSSPSVTTTPTTCPKLARAAFRCPNPSEPSGSPRDDVAGETINKDKGGPGSGDGILGDILPFTGGDIIRFVLLGLLLTSVGMVIVHRVRRARHQA